MKGWNAWKELECEVTRDISIQDPVRPSPRAPNSNSTEHSASTLTIIDGQPQAHGPRDDLASIIDIEHNSSQRRQ